MNVESLATGVQAGWTAVTTALTLLLLLGLALREAGRSRAANALHALVKPFVVLAVAAPSYLLCGFALAHGVNDTGWFGASGFLATELAEGRHAPWIQGVLSAALVALLASSALAERMRLRSVVVLTVLVSGFIYPIFESWTVAPGGWLAALGFADVGGANTVHALAGWLALAGLLVVGSRRERFPDHVYSASGARQSATRPTAELAVVAERPGHDLVLSAVGAMLVWVGFFGFVGATVQIGVEPFGAMFSNLILAGAAGIAGSAAALRITGARASMTLMTNGAIAGLVALSAEPASATAIEALAVGCVAGLLAIATITTLFNQRIDDALGIVASHGVAGAFGTVASSLFGAGLEMDSAVLSAQLVAVVACFVWTMLCGLAAFRLLVIVDGQPSGRESGELDGLDLVEQAYPDTGEPTTARTLRAAGDTSPAQPV